MAKHGGGFKSNKRNKELLRLKKQEEKRQRRFGVQTAQKDDTDEATPKEPISDEETKELNE